MGSFFHTALQCLGIRCLNCEDAELEAIQERALPKAWYLSKNPYGSNSVDSGP